MSGKTRHSQVSNQKQVGWPEKPVKGSSLNGSQETRALLSKSQHFAAYYLEIWSFMYIKSGRFSGGKHFTGGGLTAHKSEPQLEKHNTTWRKKCKCWRREVGKTLVLAVGVRMAGRLQSSCKWLSNYRTL